MKCPYCSQETPDDSTFCAECGEKLNDTPLDPSLDFPEDPDEQKARKKKKTPLLIAAAAVVLVLAVAGAVFFFIRTPGDDSSKDGQTAKTEDAAEHDTETGDEAESETEAPADPSDADFNLTTGGQLRLEGYVRSAAGNQKLLRWDDGFSFYGRNSDGTEVLLEDIDRASIDDSLLPDGMLDELSSNQKVRVDGQLYIDSGELYIMPYEIFDGDGKDLITAYEKSQMEAEDDSASSSISASGGYILPQSSARLLTEKDLSGLSLKEINYAKNEIYARHGRMFRSRELQDYFNSQSWYSGTVSPEDFSESVLSDVEKQNAQFLSSAEFSMDPNGYQLDAN